MNMNSNITGQDSSKPAEFVNSTYEALKYNPQAAQQTLQKGANAGLAGLGAMAAVRYQQQAQDVQKVEQAQQAGQQPQPTVLQQLQMIAAQQGGIMGQLPSNIAMAQQPEQGPQVGGGLGALPVDPRTLPQEMAGGGLVALAEGGFLDYSYDGGEGYADGGEVRGFATGTSEMLRALDIPDSPGYYALDELSANDLDASYADEEDERIKEKVQRERARGAEREGRPNAYQERARMPEEEKPAKYKDVYGKEPVKGETYGSRHSYSEKYGAVPSQAGEYSPSKPSPSASAKPSMIEGMSSAAQSPTHPMAEAMAKSGKPKFEAPPTPRTLRGTLGNVGRGLGALSRFAGPLGVAQGAMGMFDTLTDPEIQQQYVQDWKENMPTWLGGEDQKPLKHEAGGRNGEVPAGQESIRNPKPQVAKEATKVDKQFKSGQRDDNHLVSDAQTPAASREPASEEELRAAWGEEKALHGNSEKARNLQGRIADIVNRTEENQKRAEENVARGQTVSQTSQPSQPSQSGGLPAIQGQAPASASDDSFEKMATRMNALYGATPQMSPEERAWRKEQIESSRADKWLQTLTAMAGGTFASGETTWPAAIGKGALFGLSTYRQGAQAEAEAELGLIQADAAYKAAEAAQHKEAVKDVSSILQNMAKLGNASDIAGLKERAAAGREEYKAENKARENELNREAAFERAMLNANAIQGKDAVATSKLVEDMVKMAVEEARSTNPAIKQNDIDQIRSKIYAQFNMTPPGLGGGQGLGGGMGMGNRPIVRRDRIIPAAQQ
jgi:hypothetical protein